MSLNCLADMIAKALGRTLFMWAHIGGPPDFKCPVINGYAGENPSQLCRVQVDAQGTLICRPDIPEQGRAFLIMNGFEIANSQNQRPTRIMAADLNSATGGGCWTPDTDNNLGLGNCTTSRQDQQIYVSTSLCGQFTTPQTNQSLLRGVGPRRSRVAYGRFYNEERRSVHQTFRWVAAISYQE